MVFSLPQILYFLDGHRHAVIQDHDEMAYAARLRDVLDGHWRAASPYVWEHKTGPALTPYGGGMFLGSLAWLTGLDLDALIIGSRFVAPAALATLLTLILFALTGSAAWSAIGASLLLLDPWTYHSKPFYFVANLVFGIAPPPHMPLPYSRFVNPLVLLIPFLVTVYALFRALARPRRTEAVIAGVALGATVYAEPYYSAYLFVWILLLILLHVADRARAMMLVSIIVLALLLGGYELVQNAGKFQGQGLAVVNRYGGYLQTRGLFQVFPKGFVFIVLAFAVLYRDKRSLAYRFLLSGMLGGYGLLNQHLLTGREVLDYHYNYANALVAGCALVTLAKDRLAAAPRWIPAERWGRVLATAGVVVVVWLLANGALLQGRNYAERMRPATSEEGAYPSNMRNRFPRTIAWINASAPRDTVFMADAHLAFVIPTYTHANVFLNPILVDDGAAFMSDEELFERYVIFFKTAGFTATDVFDVVRFRPPMPFPSWKFGRTAAMQATYDLTRSDDFVRALETDSLARDYVRAYERVSAGDVRRGLSKYRLDYLALRVGDERFRASAPAYFSDAPMEEAARIPEEGIQIFRIRALGSGGRPAAVSPPRTGPELGIILRSVLAAGAEHARLRSSPAPSVATTAERH